MEILVYLILFAYFIVNIGLSVAYYVYERKEPIHIRKITLIKNISVIVFLGSLICLYFYLEKLWNQYR